MKTTADIEHDIYLVAKDYLAGRIGGSVYKEGTRPRDSAKEDAVIVVSFASTGQRQEASVYVNIFVPDTASGHGEGMQDKARLQKVASMGSRRLSTTPTLTCRRHWAARPASWRDKAQDSTSYQFT